MFLKQPQILLSQDFFRFMLKNKKIKILILILIIVITLFFDFSFLNSNSPRPDLIKIKSPPLRNPEGGLGGEVTNSVILEINNVKYQSEIKGEISVADFMEKLKNEGKINFIEKNYTGMGKFIESINGIKNGEKSWIYYVNGKKANIGISNYKINSGDVVSWKYEKGY